MDGVFVQPLEGPGNEPRVYWGSFQCNGTSNPSTSTFRAPPGLKAFTVTYGATGVFTITVPAGYGTPGQPACVLCSAEAASVATAFEVVLLGETTLNTTARQIVLQAKQGTSGFAPTNAAGNRIHFAVFFNNSTGG